MDPRLEREVETCSWLSPFEASITANLEAIEGAKTTATEAIQGKPAPQDQIGEGSGRNRGRGG